MLYAYRMVLYKVLLKKMRFRKLMLFFTGLPLENCEFLFRRCSCFCVEGCKKKDNFFHRQPNKAWRIPKSFKCSVYQRYFLDLSRIIFLWSCGHFSKPHFVLKLKIRTFCDAAFSFYDHCRHIYTCYKKMETCFEFVFLRAFQWTNRYLILGILKPSKS